MNPFEDPLIASRYEQWYAGAGRKAAELEKRLLTKLLARFPDARTALEIGCGTGYFTRWLQRHLLEVVGLDLSLAMLVEARRNGEIPVIRGDALNLPFADRTFDLSALITSLEFLSDPVRAISEGARVARQGLLIGAVNRWSLVGLRYRFSERDLWRSAQFFSPPTLKRLIYSAIRGRTIRAVEWRTTLWPVPGVDDLGLPCGGFVGLTVNLADGDPSAD